MSHNRDRAIQRARVANTLLAASTLLACVSCNPVAVKPVGDEPPHCPSPLRTTCWDGEWIDAARQVDILLIVDNSDSMGEEQRKLSRAVTTLSRALEDARFPIDYRVAITTTDVGSPQCTSDVYPRPPANGQLIRDSCRSRLGGDGVNDFESKAAGLNMSAACTDVCDPAVHDALLDPFRATGIERDGSVRVRPWYEVTANETNLPDGVASAAAALPENLDSDPSNDITSMGAALRCGVPQGINGCGYESPLEAMRAALDASEDPDSPSYGFIRERAQLVVVIVSDEVDCSMNPALQQAFVGVDGSWAWEPGADAPTSAICWNAGVECVGDPPGPYDDCVAVDRDLDGAPLGPEQAKTEAILTPLAGYLEDLEELEDIKRQHDQHNYVLFYVIGGAPLELGVDEGLLYADDPDPEAQIEFGIGPGCQSADGDARPPVRLRALTEALEVDDERTLYSVCGSTYDEPMDAIVSRLHRQLGALCLKQCVADTDPDTDQLDPHCGLWIEDAVTDERIDIPECVRLDPSGEHAPPDGAERCFVYRHDAHGLTADDDDDMSQQCVDEGWNLEFHIVMSTPLRAHERVLAYCELSDLVARDCPEL